MPLKHKEDGAIPTKKVVFLETRVSWEGMGVLTVDEEVTMVESEGAMVIHKVSKVAADESDLEENPVK